MKGCSFQLVSVDPRIKDGGVFVKFKYKGTNEDLSEVVEEIKAAGDTAGGFPSWTGFKRKSGTVWKVKGEPWLEVRLMLSGSLLH